MKSFFRVISITALMLLTLLFIYEPTFATEVIASTNELEDNNNLIISESYYELQDKTNDPNNQIINIPINTLPSSLSNKMSHYSLKSVDQLAFEYHFENYVKLQVNFNGGTNTKVTLTFDTYSWSNSEYFNVNMYTTSGELKASKPIWKTYGNPASVYFYLPAGSFYYFKFDNSNYGEKIDGVGYWTLEN